MDERSESRTGMNTTESVEKAMAERRRKLDGERQEREMKEQLDRLGAACTRLAEQAAQFAMDYGYDDFRTEMMMEFLDMLIEINESMKLFSATSSVMATITEAIGMVDDVMNFNREALTSTTKTKYGFFRRLREKRRLKKAMRNNQARMMAMYDTILAQQEMATGMTESLGRAAASMRERREKLKAKRAKRNEKLAKRGKTSIRFSDGSAAARMVAGIVAARSGENVPEGAGAAPVPPPAAPGSTEAGVPDISDIIK